MNLQPRLWLVAFCFISATIPVAAGVSGYSRSSETLSVELVGNHYRGDTTRTGIHVSNPNSHFHVVLTNKSNKPVRLWEEWNSWGFYNLKFELFDTAGKSLGEIKKNEGSWSRNIPSFIELKPNQHYVIDIHWNSRDWNVPIKPMGERDGPSKFRLGMKYSTTASAESKEHQVWNGVIESDPIDITLGYWPAKPK